MRRLLALGLLLALATGCAGRPLGSQAVVSTLYLDRDEAGWQAVLVYVTSSESADAGQAQPEAALLTGAGESVARALQAAQAGTPLTLFYGQNELLLLGPGAQGEAMYEACAYLANDSAGRPNMAVFGVELTAEDWQAGQGEERYALLRQIEQAAGESLYTQRLHKLAGAGAGLLPTLTIDAGAGSAVPGATRLYRSGDRQAEWGREKTALAALMEGQARSFTLEASTSQGPVRYTLELPVVGWQPTGEAGALALEATLSGYLKNLTGDGGLIHTGKQALADEIAAGLRAAAGQIVEETFGQGCDLLRLGFWLRARDAAACDALLEKGNFYQASRVRWEVRLRAL